MHVPKPTLNGLFLARAAESARDPAFLRREGDRWEPVFWHQALATTREISLGLAAEAGVGEGDRVAILASVRPEWVAADHAVLSLGAVTVGLYEAMSPDQLTHVLRHSGAKVALVESAATLARVEAVAGDLPDLERIFTLEPCAPAGRIPVAGLDALRRAGAAVHAAHPSRFEDRALAVEPEHLATLVYTSGTTGPPKGAMLTHGNLFYVVDTAARKLPHTGGARSVVYLPLAHVLQRFAVYLGEWHGALGYFVDDPHRLGDALREARPDVIAAVPRVLEKVHERVQGGVAALPAHRQAVFRWALSVGQQVAARRREGRGIPPYLGVQERLADRLVLRRIREQLGGNLKLVVSGGAPLSPALSEFFDAVGILAIEGYGLTETSAPVSTNTPDEYRFGTVGRPIPGTEIRIAPDGEILARGPGIFRGYYRDPGATAAAFTEDGFFRTGDIGELTEDGFLRITGRKKEMIVTATGKNVAPTAVEDLLQRGRLVSQAMVVGDRRPYLAALIVPDREALAGLARERGLDPADEGLATRPEVVTLLGAEIAGANARLSRHEAVRRFDVLPHELTVESGELTPTMKLRREVVASRHRARIDALYAGGGFEVP
ncbi:long-chain fatty acid--CoA ligase [Myxococcota bacterium]|nr:long-chain fatty acid--CoA ligase [Myxococcota bacterium]